jgi:hypothetical protein
MVVGWKGDTLKPGHREKCSSRCVRCGLCLSTRRTAGAAGLGFIDGGMQAFGQPSSREPRSLSSSFRSNGLNPIVFRRAFSSSNDNAVHRSQKWCAPEFPPLHGNRRWQWRLMADIVEKVENREAPNISRKSNVSDLSRSKPLQQRYERRWLFLR